MVATDKVFAGSIPEIYDRLMVPMLFEPFAADLARRVAARAPSDVLETAAGTGVLTRALAAVLPPATRIVATDLNQPMLDLAARRQSAGAVTWQQADALSLGLPDTSFDVVACQFGVMFFPDRVQGYREARRVLRPQGRLLFSVWDSISVNQFTDVATSALAEVFPDDPPRFMARTPHGYHDPQRLRDDVAAAGFADIRVEAVSRASSARDVAVALCQGTPLRTEIEARDAARLEEATGHATAALEQRFGRGPVEGRIRALVVSAAPG
ncbi:class I SAM-dependent methyltransferase [Reyranella sp.]|uniref:class I SAM-dependent methyltransferase n=1 Tax=Reyranella sp. TaxID=1929291 RepID=UPI003BAD87A5